MLVYQRLHRGLVAIDYSSASSSATRTRMISSMEKYKQKRLSKTYVTTWLPVMNQLHQSRHHTWYGQVASNMVAAVFWSASTPQP